MRSAILHSVARPLAAARASAGTVSSPCIQARAQPQDLSSLTKVYSSQLQWSRFASNQARPGSRPAASGSSSTSTAPPARKRSPLYRRPGVYVLAAIPLIGIPLLLRDDDDESSSKDKRASLTLLSNRDLVRSYVVYSLCSFPSLIDIAPALIEWAWSSYIPGVKFMAELVIKFTFFEQFVGAEKLEESHQVVEKLAKNNIGTLFNYSVEASEASSGKNNKAANNAVESPIHEGLFKEIASSVDYAAQMNQKEGLGSAIAFKFSGLLKDPSVLLRVSSAIVRQEHFTDSGHLELIRIDLWDYLKKTITADDLKALDHLLTSFEQVGERARAGNVKLIIDAEQSWLQPAIDALYLELARKANRVEGASKKSVSDKVKSLASSSKNDLKTASSTLEQAHPPVFYTTLQCSLRRSAPLLEAFLEDGRSRGWSVGVKVVRGAYVDQEHKAAKLASIMTPAWSSKEETDKCFNTCAQLLLDDVARDLSAAKPGAPGAMFASHNRESVTILMRLLKERGLAKPFDSSKLSFKDQPVTPDALPEPVTATEVTSSDPVLMMDLPAAQRICFGQLFGMADDITDRLSTHLLTPSRSAPAVYKYLPYGPLDRVLPYLVRRAKENKAIMTSDAGGGGAHAEKRRLKAEMRKRIKAWWRGDA
ncbi:unnamed protein product [Sympodiomycopsis kandeliae]